MLKKLLLFLFPNTIYAIANDIMHEADIVAQYGSLENYYVEMQRLAEEAIAEQEHINYMLEQEQSIVDELTLKHYKYEEN